MSISDADISNFAEWIVDEIEQRGAFTALVVLVEIGEQSVTPVASTYLNVIGDEIDWPEIVTLFAGAGVRWDGASFYPVTAPEGGPLDNDAARVGLRALEMRVKAERLALNEGFFFDREGRRMMVEEAPAQ
ncbi:MAG: hypothetical protein R3D05_11500 [Dongiaceae bacterium]